MAADDLGLKNQTMTDPAEGMGAEVSSTGNTDDVKHFSLGCQISTCDQEELFEKAFLQGGERMAR